MIKSILAFLGVIVGVSCVAETEELNPPWLFKPNTLRYSSIWRMGDGEDYIVSWWLFYGALDINGKKEYQTRYPEPSEWEGFYAEEHPLLPEELQNIMREQVQKRDQ